MMHGQQNVKRHDEVDRRLLRLNALASKILTIMEVRLKQTNQVLKKFNTP